MAYIDPLKVMRNPQTLAAYRDYQRQVRAAGQPWLTIAAFPALGEIALLLYALSRNNFQNGRLLLAFLVLVFVSALLFLIAAVRMWLFQRANPLELP